MNPAQLVPTPDAIPVPWGWFYILLMLTFLLHLLVMNAMLGGGIIAFLSCFQKKGENQLIAREFSYKWPYTVAFAVNMGVAPLLFVQVLYGHFIYSSSVLMAVFWLSIIGLLILAYYSVYVFDFKFETLGGGKAYFAGFSVLALLVIAFFFINNMTLMVQPERWLGYFDNKQGTLLNLSDPVLYPRYLHFVIGSIAVGGLFLALVSHFNLTKSNVDKALLKEKGLTFFTHATIVQIIIGLWFLFALPGEITALFLGMSAYGTGLLVVAILLLIAALYFGFTRQVVKTSLATLLLLIAMIFIRDLVRITYLKPYFSLSDLSVKTQYSPMIFFLVVFVLGLVLIGFMVKLVFSCGKEVAK